MLLRKFTLDDADRVTLLVNDQEVSRWTAKIPFPYTREHALQWIGGMDSRKDRNPYAVAHHGDLVGCVAWWPCVENPVDIEVGYWVGRAYWNQGLASAALALMLALPEFPRQQRTVAKVLSGNTGSERVLARNGFEFLEHCNLTQQGQTVAGKMFVRCLK